MTQARLRLAVQGLGVFFALQGVGWLVAPARLAASLGMPLLDGLGRSTQIGDFASFFLTAGGLLLFWRNFRRRSIEGVAAPCSGHLASEPPSIPSESETLG